MTAPRTPTEAKKKEPKNPSEKKKDLPSPCELQRGQRGEITAQVAGEGPKAKTILPPKASGPKMVPAPLARKTDGPKGPGSLTKTTSSKVSRKKTEAKS
ncbi:histone H1oo-like [Enhydra lutris kenyoni]|uniref:Histone H1oo-like n=1 Tax=Enhydra lutris kenyoni TaxID=391180 RepID=A0A2Y9L7Y0_ENHLU|nr:histone H1oo-like [Enhydra lutris kenyoni]